MKFATITGDFHYDLDLGDVLVFNGRLAEVVGCTRAGITVRYLNWLERCWFALRHSVRVRGFWARVWAR